MYKSPNTLPSMYYQVKNLDIFKGFRLIFGFKNKPSNFRFRLIFIFNKKSLKVSNLLLVHAYSWDQGFSSLTVPNLIFCQLIWPSWCNLPRKYAPWSQSATLTYSMKSSVWICNVTNTRNDFFIFPRYYWLSVSLTPH